MGQAVNRCPIPTKDEHLWQRATAAIDRRVVVNSAIGNLHDTDCAVDHDGVVPLAFMSDGHQGAYFDRGGCFSTIKASTSS